MGFMVDSLALLAGPEKAAEVREFWDGIADVLEEFLGPAGQLGLKDIKGSLGFNADTSMPFISIEATTYMPASMYEDPTQNWRRSQS